MPRATAVANGSHASRSGDGADERAAQIVVRAQVPPLVGDDAPASGLACTPQAPERAMIEPRTQDADDGDDREGRRDGKGRHIDAGQRDRRRGRHPAVQQPAGRQRQHEGPDARAEPEDQRQRGEPCSIDAVDSG